MASRRTETGDGRQAETRDNQLSWRGAGGGRGGQGGRMDGTAASHRSAGTDGPGPGGGGGGDGQVGDSVVGARGGALGGLLPAVIFCTPETKRCLYGKGLLHNDIYYRTCNRNEVPHTINNWLM